MTCHKRASKKQAIITMLLSRPVALLPLYDCLSCSTYGFVTSNIVLFQAEGRASVAWVQRSPDKQSNE